MPLWVGLILETLGLIAVHKEYRVDYVNGTDLPDVRDILLNLDKVNDFADPRVAGWPLMSSLFPTLGFVVAYVLLIPVLQIIMKDRKPFNLNNFVIVYNFFLVLLSLWMVEEMVRHAYFVAGYKWFCNNVDRDPKSLGLSWALYIFFVSKILEFLDTIIMALKKKNTQITFLHMYHHISMPLLWWFGIKFSSTGDSYWSAMQNSFVHVLMYSHYLATASGMKNVWWKPYLTQIQMVQFLLNLLMAVATEWCGEGYHFPDWMRRGMIAYMFSLLLLFSNFYIKAYRSSRGKTSVD
eukprot:TRINITY_DN3272_c0_g5_i7.p1 TRINITY_DN3272_c0_g5~~TRINITY_DN3272_c0_g5_i7.p1  ORF type:complete len:294 (+),score=42.42 TRINITY_DN3272_c0_g5_i7:67-948(+)